MKANPRTAEEEAYTDGTAEGKAASRPPLDCSRDRPSTPRAGRSARLHTRQDGARRHQDRQQRNRRRSTAQRARRDRGGDRLHQPLSRQRVRRAQGAPRQASGRWRLRARTHLGGRRLGQPLPAADPDHVHRRRRGDVRLAQLRDLSAAGPHRRRHPASGGAHRPHVRPGRHAGRDHRPHPADLHLQPEQPDVDRRRPRRAGSFRGRGAGRHPHRARRGVRRVHPRRNAARQLRSGPRAPQRRRAADVLEGLRPRRSTHRLRGRRSRRHHRPRQGLRAVHRDERLAGRRHRVDRRLRRTAGPHRRRRPRTGPGHRHPSRRRIHRAPVTGELRLVAAGRTHHRVRQQRRRQPVTGAALRPGRRPRHRRPRRTKTTPSSSSPPLGLDNIEHRTKDVRRVDRTHRRDSRCRAGRLLGHLAARHRRLHDRRVEGRRVRDRPSRERFHDPPQLVRQDVPSPRPTPSRWCAWTPRGTSSPTPRP